MTHPVCTDQSHKTLCHKTTVLTDSHVVKLVINAFCKSSTCKKREPLSIKLHTWIYSIYSAQYDLYSFFATLQFCSIDTLSLLYYVNAHLHNSHRYNYELNLIEYTQLRQPCFCVTLHRNYHFQLSPDWPVSCSQEILQESIIQTNFLLIYFLTYLERVHDRRKAKRIYYRLDGLP